MVRRCGERGWRGWMVGGWVGGWVVGGETCLYFLGIRRQMGALRGGLRSRPPWMAGKLTPIWLCGLYCALPACRPGTGWRPVHWSLYRPLSPVPYKVFTQNPTRPLNLLLMQEFVLLIMISLDLKGRWWLHHLKWITKDTRRATL